ncbi:SusC/RagA family TonB-linked outer membrane protein [Compostibacter hankyongensis]|uniref:TonB-dependent receptor n=1 Tax=Compostibacter hankyongensis TaxID=1007089 RepID=A0ABP8G2U9_9BACT
MKHISILNITMLLILAMIGCLPLSVRAQDSSAAIQGVVSDPFGKPLLGVLVNSGNGRNGTSTDAGGAYTLTLDDGSDVLIFSKRGYLIHKTAIGDRKEINISLERDVHKKDEVVDLGYTTQLRNEVSGAVATVSGEELERAPVANFTQTLPGRLPGLTTQEVYSELSRATTNLYIRGLSAARDNGPLVVIDGIVNAYNSNQSLEYISPNEIESITLLKDASTEALYGIEGANGVIVVKTKRGRKGKLQVSARFDQSLQQVTTRPAFYSAADYATMRNQAAINDGETPFFTDEQIEKYRSGNDPSYPNNNWYDRYMKDFAVMQRVGVNVTGGDDRIQYFSNLNIMHQGGQFKTDQTRYNPNANDVWVNYRSNVDMNINRYLKAYVRLSGNIKRERTPGKSNEDVYGSIFKIPSNMYGPVTPPVLDDTGGIADPGGQVLTTQQVNDPTYGMLNRTGYVRHTVTNISSQFGLDLDMGFLTKGLSLSGVFAYQTNSVGSLSTTQDYERWTRTDDLETLDFVKKGGETNTPLAYSKSHSYYYHLSYNARLNYNRTFGRHQVSGMAYAFYQNLTKADVSSPLLLPYNRLSSGLEGTYGYDGRYFVKLDVGYSGSEQYARDKRFIATPAVSAAWVLSNETFLKGVSWLSNLKLRASYGKTANDRSDLARFAYLDDIRVTRGGPLAYLQYYIDEGLKGNPGIQAEVSKKMNFGIDIGLFNALSVSVDVFRERMDNMIVEDSSAIPAYQGIPLEDYPGTNTGAFENKGYEISVTYDKVLSRNLSFSVGGMLSYARNTVLDVNEPPKTEDYTYKKWREGYAYGQQFGYLVDYSNGNGFFNTKAELDNSPAYSFGQPRLGDLRYRDLNNDGIIDERDQAPVGTGLLPRVVYSMSAGVTYHAFELNVLFQGVGDYSTMMNGTGIWETDYDGVFGALHAHAWTAERYANHEKITWPALSLNKSVSQELSDFVNYNRAYLRLKNVELAYTLPASLSKKISMDQIRVLLSGQNLVTWDKMKSKDFGPEGGGYLSFPVYRVYNIGVNVTF